MNRLYCQTRDREGSGRTTSRIRAVLIRAATVRERTNGERDQLPVVFLSPAMVRRRCTQRCNVKRTGSVEWSMPSFADRLLTRAALRRRLADARGSEKTTGRPAPTRAAWLRSYRLHHGACHSSIFGLALGGFRAGWTRRVELKRLSHSAHGAGQKPAAHCPMVRAHRCVDHKDVARCWPLDIKQWTVISLFEYVGTALPDGPFGFAGARRATSHPNEPHSVGWAVPLLLSWV